MNIEEALQWADVFGKIQSDPPTGDAPALTALAEEVRKLRTAISETLTKKDPTSETDKNMKTETGVMVMKNGKAWGCVYRG